METLLKPLIFFGADWRECPHFFSCGTGGVPSVSHRDLLLGESPGLETSPERTAPERSMCVSDWPSHGPSVVVGREVFTEFHGFDRSR